VLWAGRAQIYSCDIPRECVNLLRSKAPLVLTPSDGDASNFTVYTVSLRCVSSSLLPPPFFALCPHRYSLLSNLFFFLCLIVCFDGQNDYGQGILGAYTVT